MWGFLLKLSASLIILYLLFRQIPIHELKPYFIHLDLAWFLASYSVLLLSFASCALRWQMIMKTLQFSAPKFFYLKQTFIGNMFSQILPTSVGGDAYRIIASTRLNQSKKIAVFGVLIDRLYGLAGLLIIGLFAFPSAYVLLPKEVSGLILCFNIIFFIVLGILIAISDLKISFRHYSLNLISELAHTIVKSIDSFRDLIAKFAITLLHAFLTITVFLFIAYAQGISVKLLDLMIVVPSLLILSMLPISLGGWGVREGGLIFLGSFIGLTKSESMAIALLFGFNNLLGSIPGLWLYWKQK